MERGNRAGGSGRGGDRRKVEYGGSVLKLAMSSLQLSICSRQSKSTLQLASHLWKPGCYLVWRCTRRHAIDRVCGPPFRSTV